MKRFITALFIAFSLSVSAQTGRNDFFNSAQAFFSQYISKGKVDYAAVKKDSVFVTGLVKEIETFNLRQSGKNSRKAFYLNAYNILVIKSVADNYPVKSPLDINGFFDAKVYTVAGEETTLDELEKVTLGNEYEDPRIHFWLVPAANGSAALNSNAILISNLDDLLNEQAKTALNNEEYIGVDAAHKDVLLPMNFKVYESDFTRDGKTMLDFINIYRKKKIPVDYKINFYPLNWDLNDARKTSKTKDKIVVIPAKIDTVASTDSTLTKKKKRTYIEYTGDDILSEGSNFLTSVFQLRFSAIVNSQRSFYNGEWNRINDDVRASHLTFAVQGWNRITNKINFGLQLTYRSLTAGSFESSPYSTFSFSNSKNSKVYFRDVTNSLKFLLHDYNSRWVYQTSLLVPVSKNNAVTYKGISVLDNLQTQWINQLFFIHQYSQFFTLNAELNQNLRFKSANAESKFTVRSSLTPEFNYWFSRSFKFYAYLELNPQLTEGAFSSFYFREGAGLTVLSGKTFQSDLQYFYNALGKRANATQSLMLGCRLNF